MLGLQAGTTTPGQNLLLRKTGRDRLHRLGFLEAELGESCLEDDMGSSEKVESGDKRKSSLKARLISK